MEPMRKIATSIAIDPDLIGRMDQAAADLDRSRSYVARLAFEEFLASRSSPLGGQGHAALPGPPTTADAPCHRGGGTAAGQVSPVLSGGSFQSEELLMTDLTLREIAERCTAPIRQLQEGHAKAATSNQAKRNAEVNSPAPVPRGAGHDAD